MAYEPMFDTDVAIEFLRGSRQAIQFVDELTQPCISIISVAELYAGVRDGSERTALDTFVANIDVINLSEDIAVKGGLYRRDFGKSHGVGFNDALIAATAELEFKSLATFNRKHFPMLADVIVPYQRA